MDGITPESSATHLASSWHFDAHLVTAARYEDSVSAAAPVSDQPHKPPPRHLLPRHHAGMWQLLSITFDTTSLPHDAVQAQYVASEGRAVVPAVDAQWANSECSLPELTRKLPTKGL